MSLILEVSQRFSIYYDNLIDFIGLFRYFKYSLILKAVYLMKFKPDRSDQKNKILISIREITPSTDVYS